MRGAPNLRRVVRRFATPITFERFDGSPSVNADGLEVDAATYELEGRAFFHPEGAGRRHAKLAGGTERVADLRGYTDVAVRAPSDSDGTRGDRFAWQGLTYEIQTCGLWVGGSRPWYEVTAKEVRP